MKDLTKAPRLYTTAALAKNRPVELETAQAHYLKSVLRLSEGEQIRLFNGQDGEWRATLQAQGKKTATAHPCEQTAAQPENTPALHLLFAPIKKHRMEILIEKAVELGVTDLHPVITAHTEVRKINTERLKAQIVEAAEQCERLDIPKLHNPAPLLQAVNNWSLAFPVYWAAERTEQAENLAGTKNPQAFLIGPEGGFHEDEKRLLSQHEKVRPLSLGPRILRAETASIVCLTRAALLQDTKK